MKKKTVLVLSSILLSVTLIGATFAAYAVTDAADPLGINVTPGTIDEDTSTQYVTLKWGNKTSMQSVENAKVGVAYKLGVISLESTVTYTGVLNVILTDETAARPQGQDKFIDYLKLYLYDGANPAAEEGKLPTSSPLAYTAKGDTSLTYLSAIGTASGKEYCLYAQVDETARYTYADMANDVVDISIDWNAQSGDIDNQNKTVYFASHWEQAYLYTWGSAGSNANYPGVQLSKVGMNQYDENIYEGIILSGYDKMIFSNGGNEFENKTWDLTIADYDFSEGALLFWRNEDGSAGNKVFDSSDIANYAANLGANPGPILHAWGWTNSVIESRLSTIAAAGYKAIQICPMQPLPGGTNTDDGWYMVYQPLGLCVAEKDKGQNPFGDESTLAHLTAAAANYGIDIIVDVVANHLASEYGHLHSGVYTYEKEIYEHQDLYLHQDDGETSDDIYWCTHGKLGGLPDLNTASEYVQGRVISMLNKYIDCGVRGFRFDAAKHIETPDDPEWARSDFWNTVIGAANEHAIKNNKKIPYCYGEVLGLQDRSWSGYTKYMDVTDYGVIWQTRDKFNQNKEQEVINNSGYSIKQSAEYALLYAESHDNFVHGDTSSNDDVWMDMQYCWHVSRAGSTSLYFARPQVSERRWSSDPKEPSNNWNATKIVINTPVENYHSSIVSAANKLHNDFVGGSEYLSQDGGCIINCRQKDGKVGICIVNLHNASSVNISVAAMGGSIQSGTYKNLVNNTNYSFNNYKINVPLTNGVAILELQ